MTYLIAGILFALPAVLGYRSIRSKKSSQYTPDIVMTIVNGLVLLFLTWIFLLATTWSQATQAVPNYFFISFIATTILVVMGSAPRLLMHKNMKITWYLPFFQLLLAYGMFAALAGMLPL